ncbi:MAG: FKBP-type peptidyl-prolyl cis-trans isomerase [Clostridia bacterium]|nr:FKBP-type peptidyl-prolyl cis-trans isomerase [Clostridia bacterium]
MKRIIILMLCLCVGVAALTACNNNDVDKLSTTTAAQTTTVPNVDDGKYALSNILATDFSQYVTLGEYKNIEIRSDSKEYQDLRKQFIEYYLMQGGFVKEYENREVVKGDTVNIDYVGYCDGVPFEGGDTKGRGTEVTIGSGQYIDDFEEQLIGYKPGDTVNVNVTFPEDYGNDKLAGKDALFVVKVNFIASAPVYPDLAKNPDILKKCFNYDSMDAFEEGIKKEIGTELVLKMAMDAMTVKSYPQDRLDAAKKQIEDLYTGYAQMYGMSLEDFLKAQEIDVDELSKNQVKNEMFFLAIAQSEGFDYTDEEYEQLCEDYAKKNSYASLDALLQAVGSRYSSNAHAKYDLATFLVQEMAKKVVEDSVNVIIVK